MTNEIICGWCTTGISAKQRFVKCQGKCDKKYHIKCLNIKAKDHKELLEANFDDFRCPLCCLEVLPKVDKTLNTSFMSELKLDLGETNSLIRDLIKTVLEMKTEILVLKADLSEVKSELKTIKEENSSIKESSSKINSNFSQNSKTYLEATKVTLENQKVKKPNIVAPPQHASPAKLSVTPLQMDDNTSYMTNPQRSTNEAEDGFIKVTYKKNKKSQSMKPIIGSKTFSSLKTRIRTKKIFASRFDPSTTIEDITNELIHISKEIKCYNVKTKFPTYNSFTIEFPENLEEAILDPSNWPYGIILVPHRPNYKKITP